MTSSRLRVPVLLAALILAPALNCGSVTPSPDGGGAAGTGTAGAAGGGTGGATGGSIGRAGAAGGGHDGGAAGGGGTAGAGHDGSAGSGHDGGGGQGGSGASCSDLQNQYAAAFADAQMCTVGASGQCAQLASAQLSPCGFGCMYYVDDTTTLNATKAAWQAAGCDSLVGVACPAIAYVCSTPHVGTCLGADGGAAKCVTSAGVITTATAR